jgi:hypothetical protein
MTFDATPRQHPTSPVAAETVAGTSVCDLGGAERFVVWAVRWEASQHDDVEFARDCLDESFARAGLGHVTAAFRSYMDAMHGAPSPCAPASRLGCWRINLLEASTLHALACLQSGLFGDAWRAVSSLCPRSGAARAMLALGELAEALMQEGGRIRPWPAVAAAATAR